MQQLTASHVIREMTDDRRHRAQVRELRRQLHPLCCPADFRHFHKRC